MNKQFCDRCKREITHKYTGRWELWFFWHTVLIPIFDGDRFDLCPSCGKSLEGWLKGGSRKCP
jgi:hypothetical protein